MDQLAALARDAVPGPFGREVTGYVAAGFVLATFCMASMRWLRLTAIASNLAFIYYASIAGLQPVLILHCILLPVNVSRLLQIQFARQAGLRRLIAPTGGDLAQPAFITRAALADPATALRLAEREQQRVAGLLAARLPGHEAGDADLRGQEAASQAAPLLLDAIDGFLAGMMKAGGLSAALANRLAGLQSRNEVLRTLHETLGDLALRLRQTAAHLPAWLGVTMREGLGAILLMTEDAARSCERADIDILLSMTSDRSAKVEQIRKLVMAERAEDDPSDPRNVYVVTALYERTVWLVRRYALLLEAPMPG